MNILYFVHGFPPSIGAGAINAYKIVEYLAKAGHKILVLSPGVFSKINRKSNLKVMNLLSDFEVDIKYSSSFIKIPFNLVFSHFENMFKFLINLKSIFQPDIILSQYQAYHYASVVGGYVSKILKAPHIIRSHDIFFNTKDFSLPLKVFHSMIYSRIYSSILNCNKFYVTTSEMKRYFSKFKKLNKVNFEIQHNGIDTNEFFPFKNQEELKDKYNCNDILLFVGQISRDYDLNYIIKVLPKILKTHKDTHFLIIGSGPHQEELLHVIKKNQLTKQVHYLGIKPHEEIPFYINNCDIGIGRITHERSWRYMIPVKCLEYMACNKPFITAPCSQDLIKNNDVGLLLNRNFTEKELINKFIYLIEDNSLRKKLGDNGLKKIHKNFLWDDIMIKFIKDLNQVVSN